MTADGLWRLIPAGEPFYQPRYRRDCFGELFRSMALTMTGLEGRAPKMLSSGLHDDATGRLDAPAIL